MQRRRYVRIDLFIPIQVVLNMADDELTVNAKTLDISGGGIRFYSRQEFQVDDLLILTLPFESGEVVTVNAKVVLSRESNKDGIDGGYYTTAASFYDLSERQESLIVSECFQHELKLRRDGKI